MRARSVGSIHAYSSTDSRIDPFRSAAKSWNSILDTVLEWLRRSGVVSLAPIAEIDALAVLDECTQVESIVGAQEELARLSEAVAGLPERCRQVYTLRKVYGFTQSEIASRLRVSEETVQDYLALAARRCAHALFDRPPAATPRRVAFLSRIRRRMKPQ